MNAAHLHLTINDVPIIGAFVSAVLLTIALVARSRNAWMRAGLLALAATTGAILFAFLSGIPAVDTISGMPRTSNKALSQHHVRAIVAVVAGALAAIVGVIVFVRARRRGGGYGTGAVATLLVATIVSAAALAWTGLAGGRVNHPELQQPGALDGGPAHEH
jgi:uncharacterized membrane protein